MATTVGDPTDEGSKLYEEEETGSLDPGYTEELVGHAPTTDGVILRSNKLIPEEGVATFRSRNRVQTIVLIGEQKAGKTTLLASLYGLFCKGPIGDLEFVSSQTLYSFAERNYLAMLSTGKTVPTMPRTSIADSVGYFHFKLRNAETISEVIISDRSGEAFESARTDTSLMDRLSELALADRVCFLLDAARLTRIETRSGYRRIFKQTIQALVDNDVIPKTAVIEVLVTKIDRISAPRDGRDLSAELKEYEADLIREFTGHGHAFAVHRICALPRAAVKLGFSGMRELVERWASLPPDADIAPGPVDGALRQIDRSPYLWR